LKNAVTKAKNEVNVYKNQFDMVIKVDPDVEDIPFGKQIKKCFEEAQRLADETTKRQAEVEKAYTDACDAYLIGKSDVMR
jgi:hypothetical protein